MPEEFDPDSLEAAKAMKRWATGLEHNRCGNCTECSSQKTALTEKDAETAPSPAKETSVDFSILVATVYSEKRQGREQAALRTLIDAIIAAEECPEEIAWNRANMLLAKAAS